MVTDPMPIPSVLVGYSGTILDAILHEFNPIEPIYDLTYGTGACWKKTCGKHQIIKADISPTAPDVIQSDIRDPVFAEISTAFIDPPYASISTISKYGHAKIVNGEKQDTNYHHFLQTNLKNPEELRQLLLAADRQLAARKCQFLILKCGDSWLSIKDIYSCFPNFSKRQYLVAKQHGMRFNPSIKRGIIRSHTF
jgi:hypothetical protein